MNDTLYFAYGSNLNKVGMAGRAPEAVPAGKAVLPDWRLTFRGVADIEPAPGREVVGGLWYLTDENVKSIDQYEGHPFYYVQRRLLVTTEGGRQILAMTYTMTDQTEVGLPSRAYYDSIRDGFLDFGLPLGSLERAIDDTVEWHLEIGVEDYTAVGPKRLMAV